jgi:hypothetical protein
MSKSHTELAATWPPTADVAREAGHRPQSLRAIHTKCLDCSVVVRKPETRARQYLRLGFPVPPGHADLIADLAGLGTASSTRFWIENGRAKPIASRSLCCRRCWRDFRLRRGAPARLRAGPQRSRLLVRRPSETEVEAVAEKHAHRGLSLLLLRDEPCTRCGEPTPPLDGRVICVRCVPVLWGCGGTERGQ